MDALTNVLLSLLSGLGCREVAVRHQRPAPAWRQPNLEVLEERAIPSIMVHRSDLPASVSAHHHQPPKTAALPQSGPAIISDSQVSENSAAEMAQNSPSPGSISLTASATAQGTAQLTLICPKEPQQILGTLLAPLGVPAGTGDESGAGLIGTAESAAAGLSSAASSSNITAWVDEIVAGLTQISAGIGALAGSWAARFADLIRFWAGRIGGLALYWIPHSAQIGTSWLQAANARLAQSQDPNNGPSTLQVSAKAQGNGQFVLGGSPFTSTSRALRISADEGSNSLVLADPTFTGVLIRLPDRPGCLPGIFPADSFLNEPSVSFPGSGVIPDSSALLSGSMLQPGPGSFGGTSSGGGGGGGGSDDHSAPHVMYVSPQSYVPRGPRPWGGTPVGVLVSPALLRRGDYPSGTHSQADDDPDTDDPEMDDGGTDDPESDGVALDGSGGPVEAPSPRPATATISHPEWGEPGGRVETDVTVVAGVVSGVASPHATSSTAVATNVTVLVGIVTPAALPDSTVDVSGGPALPAPAPGWRDDTLAGNDPRPITDQLAEVRLAWPVHPPPFEVTAPGAADPFPTTGQLAEIQLAWPVHHLLLGVIVLGAFRSCGQQLGKVGTLRYRRKRTTDGTPPNASTQARNRVLRLLRFLGANLGISGLPRWCALARNL
jgi:hypothetical protein